MGGSLLVVLGGLSGARGADDANRYVGAAECKNCHSAAAKGDPYGGWAKMKHAAAYRTLASAAARKIGAAKKIDNPQQSAECLRCHVTAYGLPPAQKHRRFSETQGVQCESCHGPGGRHTEARLAKVQPFEKDELAHEPAQATCRQCHNEQSPAYKPFCFKKAAKEIAHLDPRRNHPADYFEKLQCDCAECRKKK
jgi:hypothetical protein